MFSKAGKCLLMLLVLAGLVFAGCGSGDETDAVAITKAEAVKQGDAICAKADVEQTASLEAFTKKHPDVMASQAGQEELVTAVGLPPVQAAAEELGDLGELQGGGDDLAVIAQGMEDAVELAEDDPLSVTGESANNPFNEVDKLASEFGFQACGDVL